MQSEFERIAAFLKSGKRQRYQEMLSGAKRRQKFIPLLAHFTDFEMKYRVPLASSMLSASTIAVELRRRGCPDVVYVISEDSRIDQCEVPLSEALAQTVGRGMGSVLCCLPGRLAFVETEDERFLLERHTTAEKDQYIRFVIGRRDGDSHRELGIFHAAADALAEQWVTGADADQLNELRAWFGDNLRRPSRFGRGAHSLGICWFKTAAVEHIGRIRKMAQILERNGVHVKKLRTSRPGYVIYEDEWQLVAEPYREGTL